MKLNSNHILILFFFVMSGCKNTPESIQTNLVAQSNSPQGEKLFDDKCSLCHLKSEAYAVQGIVMTGPDMNVVANQIKLRFTDKNAVFNKQQAINFISDYVFYPDETKALLPDSIRAKFSLMPSLKGSVTEEELTHIAEFILENGTAKGAE